MIDHLLAPFAPHICYGCGFVDSPLCDSCTNDIKYDDFGRCIWCMKPTANSHQCKKCATQYGASAAWAAGVRETVLMEVVDGYKFDACRGAAVELAALLDATLPLFETAPIVTWVPTTPAHIRERGFDHAALLARTLARCRGYVATPLLSRVNSLTQHTLGRAARERVASETFVAIPERINPLTPVLLVDDILTTGATLRACIRELRKHSEAGIYVAVVCRQPETSS